MRQRAWALTLVGLFGAGCGGDDFSSGQGGTGGSGASTTGGSGGAAPGGSGGAGGSGGGTGGSGGGNTGGSGGTCTSYEATLAADTNIFPEGSLATPNCGGTITAGSAPILSAGGIGGPSKTLLRFNLPPSVVAAFGKSQVQVVALTLTRDTAGGHDCGNGQQCPKGTGVLHASALRNDWVQGAGSSSGANWCWLDRATTSKQWAANGASAVGADRSATAATANVEPAMTKVTFSLGPDFLEPWVTNNQLSLIVERGDAGAPNFYHTSKEHMAAVPARLQFTVCE